MDFVGRWLAKSCFAPADDAFRYQICEVVVPCKRAREAQSNHIIIDAQLEIAQAFADVLQD